MKEFFYRAFGLVISANWPVAGFEELELDKIRLTDIDVFVSVKVDPFLLTDQQNIRVSGNSELHRIEMPSGWLIEAKEGKFIKIVVQREETVHDALFHFVGYGLTPLVIQRDMLPLHVGAVKTEKGVWLLAGRSGAGKSTTSILISKAINAQILADDVAVISRINDEQMVSFGSNTVKIWEPSIKVADLSRTLLTKDLGRIGKYQMKIKAPLPSALDSQTKVFSLRRGRNYGLRPLSKTQTFCLLLDSVHASPRYRIPNLQVLANSVLLEASAKIRGFELTLVDGVQKLPELREVLKTLEK
jgi:hypothetical protein